MLNRAVAEMLGELEASLVHKATPERAAQEKRYLKSELRFLGVTQPAVRGEARTFVRRHPELDRDTLRTLSEALWATRIHELRSVAIGILELRLSSLSAKDAGWILLFIRDAHTWAHVDWLAIKVLGPLITADPATHKQLDKWANDEDFWVRRTALLAWHDPLIKGAGDFEHFARLAASLLHEKEFFIRKAIGWVLRSTAKKRPERTIAFVSKHARELSALSFKEATRNLPAAAQKKLAAQRVSSRSAPPVGHRGKRKNVAQTKEK